MILLRKKRANNFNKLFDKVYSSKFFLKVYSSIKLKGKKIHIKLFSINYVNEKIMLSKLMKKISLFIKAIKSAELNNFFFFCCSLFNYCRDSYLKCYFHTFLIISENSTHFCRHFT